MPQLSLFDNCALAGVMPSIKAVMNRVASTAESEGRDLLLDKINRVARRAGVKLSSGNAKLVSRDTLDKWLSPGDVSHPPSINAVLVFCIATGDHTALGIMAKALGLDIMSAEDRRCRDIGRAKMAADRAAEEARKARKRLRQLEEDL